MLTRLSVRRLRPSSPAVLALPVLLLRRPRRPRALPTSARRAPVAANSLPIRYRYQHLQLVTVLMFALGGSTPGGRQARGLFAVHQRELTADFAPRLRP